MKPTLFGVDASLLLGAFACFAAAVISATIARRRTAGQRSAWSWVAVAQCLFGMEMLLGLRYRWHDAAEASLRANDWYASREPLQAALIAIVALFLAVVAAFAWRLSRSDGPAAWAACASAVTAALLLVEAVSLHAVDAVMYRPAGPVVLLAWAWALASAAVVLAAIVALRRAAR